MPPRSTDAMWCGGWAWTTSPTKITGRRWATISARSRKAWDASTNYRCRWISDRLAGEAPFGQPSHAQAVYGEHAAPGRAVARHMGLRGTAHRRHVQHIQRRPSEHHAGDVFHGHIDHPVDRPVGAMAHDLALADPRAPQAPFCIDRGAVRRAAHGRIDPHMDAP